MINRELQQINQLLSLAFHCTKPMINREPYDGVIRDRGPRVCGDDPRVMPKDFELGKFEVAKMTDTTSFERMYLKLTINGKVVIELEKLNCVCKIGDTDLMAEVREALGLS